MKTQVGMWIDHREANIVFLSQDGEKTKQIKSNVEKQLRRSGDSPSNERFETQMVPASDRREKGYMGHLANYYEEIVSVVRGAESVFIFGPGAAKGEPRIALDSLRVAEFSTAKIPPQRIFEVMPHLPPKTNSANGLRGRRAVSRLRIASGRLLGSPA